MLALPPAPAPAPRRQVLAGTAVAGAAATMLIGGQLAVWWRFREASPLREGSDGLVKAWLPENVTIPGVPTNIMLVTMFVLCLMAQYAVYAAKRADRTNTTLGLGIVIVMGLAVLNAQVFVYTQIELPIAEGAYASLFYAITGTFVALLLAAIAFTMVTAFRYLAGRTSDTEIVSSLALFWYILTGIYTAVWFVIYVTK
ncbi:MAG TPA: cytochrome c oxidase subunit 3 [Ilumatobacteraceae bacterium]